MIQNTGSWERMGYGRLTSRLLESHRSLPTLRTHNKNTILVSGQPYIAASMFIVALRFGVV